jgi:hypothetical protein
LSAAPVRCFRVRAWRGVSSGPLPDEITNLEWRPKRNISLDELTRRIEVADDVQNKVGRPIHPSAWKSNSAKFAFRGFCELRLWTLLRHSEASTFRVPHASPRLCGGKVRVQPLARPGNTSKGEKMSEQSRQPKDKNYNLIAVLYHSSDNVESLKTYIQDAEAEGDQELVDFFDGILENNLKAAQRAKEMLVPRFQGEQE